MGKKRENWIDGLTVNLIPQPGTISFSLLSVAGEPRVKALTPCRCREKHAGEDKAAGRFFANMSALKMEMKIREESERYCAVSVVCQPPNARVCVYSC